MALENLNRLVPSLIVLAISLGVGFIVLENFQSQLDSNSQGYAAVGKVITALAIIPDWLKIFSSLSDAEKLAVLLSVAIIIVAVLREKAED